MLMAGAGAPPCTTSIMWSVFEMWKLQVCNSEYNYDIYICRYSWEKQPCKGHQIEQGPFLKTVANFQKKLAEDFEDERNEESGVD